MKAALTSSLKVKFLGITPLLKYKGGILNPQEIVSLSALLTFKGKSIKKNLRDIRKNDKNLNEEVGKILQLSSLKGHASVATTPVLSLNYEGSKFLDSVLTGIYFSSSLVSSGRRTKTIKEDFVFPDKIFLDKKARKIYQEISERIIDFYSSLLFRGIKKDEASKILQYGISGTGIIQLPIESIVGLKREYLAEKEWMPEELGLLLKKIETEFKKSGVDLLYATREAAPRNIYPYPNIFKDPKKSNLARELHNKEKLVNGSKLVSMDISIFPELKKKLTDLEKKTKKTFSSLKLIKKNWFGLLSYWQEIFRDYNLVLKLKVLSSIPWRVWGEKKRHRTCPQIIESIYFCIERAAGKFNQFKKQIEAKKINKKLTREIEKVFSIPPSIKQNQQLLAEYLLIAFQAFDGYKKLINLKIKPREAIFLIPRAVKIDILQEYDFYNLLAGYYPLRLCSTAEEEMRRNTSREVVEIKKALDKRGYGWLNKFIVPKCQILGFCPEEKTCGLIKKRVRDYDKNFHREMKEELKNKFKENLKRLGK